MTIPGSVTTFSVTVCNRKQGFLNDALIHYVGNIRPFLTEKSAGNSQPDAFHYIIEISGFPLITSHSHFASYLIIPFRDDSLRYQMNK